MAVLSSGMPGGGQVWHWPEMEDEERARRFGVGTCAIAERLVVGEDVDVEFIFEIGATALPVGAALRVAWRWPFDWGDPRQMEVVCAGAELRAEYVLAGDLNPWHHHIELKVIEGQVAQGERVVLRCRGWGAPTFITRAAGFLLLINADRGAHWNSLGESKIYDVVAGVARKLVVIAEAEAAVDEVVGVRVYGEDCWGNPAELAERPVLAGPDAAIAEDGMSARFPVYLYRVSWSQEGVRRLTARAGQCEGESNPVCVYARRPQRRLVWGDMHSGQTEIGVGAGTLDDHFCYARDVSGLQFASQQANDHYITRAIWRRVRDVSHAFDESGRFVSFLGCEWSPDTADGGDRNVFYRGDEDRLRRSGRFFSESDPDPEPDLERAPEFLQAMRDEEVLLGLHVGGRPTNLAYHEPKIEALFEIHSTHGTSEWFVLDAIRRGYRVGITAGADGVMGRPGACSPGRRVTRNVRSGLTAVWTEQLSREGLWSAFKERRCYGTTGARIFLRVEVNGHGMGGQCAAQEGPEVCVQVEGTAAIERVDLLCGLEVVHSWAVAEKDEARLRVLWGGAEEEGTAGAQRVHWNGSLRVRKGRIAEVEPVGLQCPLDAVEQVDGSGVQWTSATGGNEMGFSCLLDGVEQLHFASRQIDLDIDAAVALKDGVEVDVGGASKRVRFDAAPKAGGVRGVSLSWRDGQTAAAERAYWVRVVQVDGERAWSSPVYVRPI